MSEAVWRDLAEKALGGQPLDALSSVTADDVRIEPLYPRAASDTARASRQTSGAWAIAQRVDHPGPEDANRLALIDLEGGANALTVVFAGETGRGYGMEATAVAVATALRDVELDFIMLRLDAGSDTIEAARALGALTTARRLGSAALAVDIGLDPIGCLARSGTIDGTNIQDDDLRAFMAANRAAGLSGRTFLADGRPYHEAGSGEAQELAAVLATAIAYLRQLQRTGLDIAEASASIAFLLVADADTFLSIAKFRALRLLWARVEEACGLDPIPIRLHAETAWRMMTRHDPWTNVMRVTAAVFAAGIGGADVVTALPYTLALGLPEDGARRLARNSQLVLLAESHLAAVEDPAAGSGGLEALTGQLCAKAWASFQEIEREGGMVASLESGRHQARIAATAQRRASLFATIEHGITGTSTFPPLHEAASPRADAARRPDPPRGPLALPNARDAVPFERLRNRAAALETSLGAAPSVVLATLGEPAVYGPRATYAANFFASGGLATTTLDVVGDFAGYDYDKTSPGETPPAKSPLAKSPIVCICGSDSLYRAHLVETVAKLRAVGARRILLAGSRRAVEPLDAGLDDFIHGGCNALEVLENALNVF